ncbi:hypothetical protein SAMN05444266_102164 [Chitinophaga jiangningensis]|uniref:Uncharacterized protein n=1 Tax=Chitinophaga jiangningensis TaxID=1419482 RepID=A0A1M6Y5Y6_9BACT|nr:hypothetical protein [Chitinophaga jiangningensis]SHL13583.1 hypothetical protein SAMN05444266_102164 [Chitinophaga jiangningensis]
MEAKTKNPQLPMWMEKKSTRIFLLVVGVFSSIMFLISISSRFFADPGSHLYKIFGSIDCTIQNLLIAFSTLLTSYQINKLRKQKQIQEIDQIGS